MKTFFLIIALGVLKTQAALAVATLVFTFQPGASFRACSNGSRGGIQSCGDRKCSDFSPDKAPLDACFSRSYIEVSSHNEFNVVKQSYDNQIANLTNQVIAYKDQITNTHRDLVDTLIADPQFRNLLANKIKEDTAN